jgi:hypothetical protein
MTWPSARVAAAVAALLLIHLNAVVVVAAAQYTYRTDIVWLPDLPVISDPVVGNSDFAQPFNPTYVSSPSSPARRGLLVRAQNCSHATPGGNCVHCGGEGPRASVLAFAQLLSDDSASVSTAPTFARIGQNDIVLAYAGDPAELYGTEDPRAFWDEASKLWLIFYTCYGRKPPPSTDASILLCLATAKDPTRADGGWVRRGPVFPTLQDSKSAALVAPTRPGRPYTMLWGAGKIQACKSHNPLVWSKDDCTPFLEPRGPPVDRRPVLHIQCVGREGSVQDWVPDPGRRGSDSHQAALGLAVARSVAHMVARGTTVHMQRPQCRVR